MNQYAPCPKCGGSNAEKMSFTWWGGLLGPKLLTHVKCPNCKATFNGKTGKDNTTNIIIYTVIVGIIVFAIFFVFMAVAVLIMMNN